MMRALLTRAAASIALCLALAQVASADAPKNVILFIGDGMGFEHVKAGGMYAYGQPGLFPFESFPYRGEVTTYSANNDVTDSAAAATAIATGHKVNNGVISMAIPGDGSELYTLLEYSRDRGKRTGLVTTTYMTHATPAAFGAHESSRNYTARIARDYLNQTRPNVLLGGGAHGLTLDAAEQAGYSVVTDRAQMATLDPNGETYVSGQFATDHLPYEYDYFSGSDDGYDFLPHLSEMTAFTLDMLEEDSDGFFMMVEGGRIDHAAHGNNIQRNVFETIEFNNAVQLGIDWAAGRDDTLILVTADHETGGLMVLQNNGQGEFPTVDWSTGGHTGVNVPIYAWGVNAHLVSGVMNNTDLFDVMTIPEPGTVTALVLLGLLAHLRAGRSTRKPLWPRRDGLRTHLARFVPGTTSSSAARPARR